MNDSSEMISEKTMFEIPIYSMTEKEFDKRWGKFKGKTKDTFLKSGHSEESASNGMYLIYYPEYLWKYNQIIGYLEICVNKVDVIFKIHRSLDSKYYAKSTKKHFIYQNIGTSGLHFNIQNKNNIQIINDIKNSVKQISKTELKQFHLDCSTFNTIIDNLNIEKIIDSL